MTSRNNRQHGYSLIEVLVAFVILATALTVLFRIFSSGLRNVDAASDYTQAVLIADTQMALPGSVDPLLPGQTEGDVAGRFKWTRSVSEYRAEHFVADAVHVPPAYIISVEVQWPAGGGVRRIQFETIRLDDSPILEGRL